MTRLAFLCAQDPADAGSEQHETVILMARCDHCHRYAIAGYRCLCGNSDVDPKNRLVGHGSGECVDDAR